MLTNYHTHHYRCGHADGDIEDYVLEAIKQDYKALGISCHVPFENFIEMGSHRMNYQDLIPYLQEIEALQVKYPALKILKAFECEYFPQVHEYMEELATQTDYLILAGHFIFHEGEYQNAFSFRRPEQLEIYAKQVSLGMKTGLFKFLAHPDVFMTSYPKWDATCVAITHEIAKVALEYGVMLEVNANGLRRRKQPYPSMEFWQVIANDYPEIKVLTNSDHHSPKLLNDEYMKQARQMAKALNLNVVTEL